ncbi:MAG: dipeptide ABC transporter ATP-binding protein [Flavobacteriaceae bacterium]
MAKSIKKPVLSLTDFSLSLGEQSILEGLELNIFPNEIVALVGESGSGKSVTAQAIMGLLPPKIAQINSGTIEFNERPLPKQNSPLWHKIRGLKIGMIFQEPQSSLNPTMRCGKQVAEMGRRHLTKLTPQEIKAKVIRAFEEVHLIDPERIYKAYPHQLSGGQKQRVMIAMALLCEPQLLIADEPTTALDVLVQKDIIKLLKDLQRQNNMSVLFISHDLSLVANLADRIAVMQQGKIVEMNPTKTIFSSPQHPYTQGLIGARPETNKRLSQLPTLADFQKGSFTPQLLSEEKRKTQHEKLYAQKPLLSVRGLQKTYLRSSFLFGSKEKVQALKTINFNLYPGETLGLVGASGCGKSTLAKAMVFLDPPSAGEILWQGQPIDAQNSFQIARLRKDVQFIFQDPYTALHPLKRIGEAIDEVLQNHTAFDKCERTRRLHELLLQVGLSAQFSQRYPHELSGGQRQRVVIARALAVEPRVLLCDESVAALDISVQAQVINLLNHLKKTLRLSFLFISHDLAVVKHMADRILVMNQGEIVEENEADALYQNPQTAYTKALLDAIPNGL